MSDKFCRYINIVRLTSIQGVSCTHPDYILLEIHKPPTHKDSHKDS